MKRALPILLFLLTAAPAFSVSFIENDFTKAVAQAKTKKLPIFVDAWAPW